MHEKKYINFVRKTTSTSGRGTVGERSTKNVKYAIYTFYTYTYLPSLTRDVNLVSLVEKAHGKDSMPVACT